MNVPKCLQIQFDKTGGRMALFVDETRDPHRKLVGDVIILAWPGNTTDVELGDHLIEGNLTQPRGYLLKPGEPYPIKNAAISRWYVAGTLDDGVSALFVEDIEEE